MLCLIVFLTGALYAEEHRPSSEDQPRQFPKVEDMHNRKWQFLVSKAQLSQKEVDAVQPVFMEYEKGLWDFHNKNGEFFKSVLRNRNDNNVNYDEITDRIAQTKITEAFMFRNYHQKLKKILSSEKLFRYYGAENEYKQTLLRTLPGGPNQNGRRPERP